MRNRKGSKERTCRQTGLHEVVCILPLLPTGRFVLLCVLCGFVVQTIIYKSPLIKKLCFIWITNAVHGSYFTQNHVAQRINIHTLRC